MRSRGSSRAVRRACLETRHACGWSATGRTSSRRHRRRAPLVILLHQFRSPLIYILLAATQQFFWERLLDGRPIILPDGGEGAMQWVFVSDLAEACVRAIEVPEAAGEAFNIAHVEPHTQRSFVETLARVAGVAPTFAPMPRATIQAAGGHPFVGNLYFGEYPDLPPHTSVVDKAERVLGVTPTSLETALGAGFAWYQTQPRREVDYTFEDRLLAGSRVTPQS